MPQPTDSQWPAPAQNDVISSGLGAMVCTSFFVSRGQDPWTALTITVASAVVALVRYSSPCETPRTRDAAVYVYYINAFVIKRSCICGVYGPPILVWADYCPGRSQCTIGADDVGVGPVVI